jgi:Calcium binding
MSRIEDESKPAPDEVPQALAVGDRVRVRGGIRDPDFPDIPLGGWSGTVLDADDSSDEGRLLLVEWSDATLRQMHPVYRYRCERDGLEIERSWLYERELELDTGELVSIEQPATLTPRPLDLGEQDDRLRAVFDLTSDEPLPAPNQERLAHYHRFLSDHLHFPLDAVYAAMNSYLPGKEEPVQFVGLTPLEQVHEENGLLAEIERNGTRRQVELFDVETPRNDYARQLIGDYSYWFCEASHYAVVAGGRQEIRTGRDKAEEEASPWPVVSALVRCGLYGAVCGVVIGAITAAVPGAALGMLVAGGMFAGAGYFLGSRFGFVLRALRLADKAPLLGGIFGTFAGAVLGAVLGPIMVAFPGTVLGSIAGFIVGRTLALVGVKRPGGVLGGVIGAGMGGVALAWFTDQEAAARGMLYGGLLGAAIGVVLVLMFFVSLMLFESRRNDSE